LTRSQVEERRARGQANVVSTTSTRTVRSILRANVLTRFNAIIGVLLVVVLLFGPIQDALLV
jgi:cation-transporting ATPase E